MRIINSRLRAILSLFLFSVGLAACGGLDTSSQDCDGEPCLEGSGDGPGTVGQPAMCGEQSNCDDGGGGGWEPPPQPTTGTVTVALVNSLNVQATFYASGGGVNATTTYYVTRWTPAWGSAVIASAMSGPIGSPLSMTTQLNAEGFPRYTHECWVTPTTADTQCTISAERNPDGFAVLSCACVPQ